MIQFFRFVVVPRRGRSHVWCARAVVVGGSLPVCPCVKEVLPMLKFGTLLDLLKALPPGSLLSTTPQGADFLAQSYTDLSPVQACDLVQAIFFDGCDAEYDAEICTLFVSAGLRWLCCPLFRVVLPEGSEKGCKMSHTNTPLHDNGFHRLIELSAEYSTNYQSPSVCQLMAQLSPDGVTFLQVNSFSQDMPIVRLHVDAAEFASLVQAYQSYMAERETLGRSAADLAFFAEGDEDDGDES